MLLGVSTRVCGLENATLQGASRSRDNRRLPDSEVVWAPRWRSDEPLSFARTNTIAPQAALVYAESQLICGVEAIEH